MPNLKQEIVKRLAEFPASIQPGKAFPEYLDDLADDIQADVIKALVPWLVPQPIDPELEHRVDMAANNHFGATLHNLVFLDMRNYRIVTDADVKRMTRAMLRTLLLEEAQLS